MNWRQIVLAILVAVTVSACSEVKLTDVSLHADYKPIVGAQYEVMGTLYAHGIRRHAQAPVHYITLVPPPGFDGSEVGFRVPIELGSRITITRVMRTNRWIPVLRTS